MAQYEFLTSWCVDAPIERVFEVLRDSQAFPEWWKGVTSVEVLEPGGPDGVRRAGPLQLAQRPAVHADVRFGGDAGGAAVPDRGPRDR